MFWKCFVLWHRKYLQGVFSNLAAKVHTFILWNRGVHSIRENVTRIAGHWPLWQQTFLIYHSKKSTAVKNYVNSGSGVPVGHDLNTRTLRLKRKRKEFTYHHFYTLWLFLWHVKTTSTNKKRVFPRKTKMFRFNTINPFHSWHLTCQSSEKHRCA